MLDQSFSSSNFNIIFLRENRKGNIKQRHLNQAYFDKHDEFHLENFVQEVVKEPELIEKFKEHKQNYDSNQGLVTKENFSISNPAVKTMKKKIKNLIKLDTEIEIKVKNPTSELGNMQFIERGFDEERGMSFYKVFFNEEE